MNVLWTDNQKTQGEGATVTVDAPNVYYSKKPKSIYMGEGNLLNF